MHEEYLKKRKVKAAGLRVTVNREEEGYGWLGGDPHGMVDGALGWVRDGIRAPGTHLLLSVLEQNHFIS